MEAKEEIFNCFFACHGPSKNCVFKAAISISREACLSANGHFPLNANRGHFCWDHSEEGNRFLIPTPHSPSLIACRKYVCYLHLVTGKYSLFPSLEIISIFQISSVGKKFTNSLKGYCCWWVSKRERWGKAVCWFSLCSCKTLCIILLCSLADPLMFW